MVSNELHTLKVVKTFEVPDKFVPDAKSWCKLSELDKTILLNRAQPPEAVWVSVPDSVPEPEGWDKVIAPLY
jgi:hypothetical protein